MKKSGIWICTAVAAALLAACQAAQTVNIGSAHFNALPADGNTITINGSVRTFKTVVAAASTQVAIAADTNAMAVAYAAQLASFPYTDISVHQHSGSVFLVGKADAAMTASFTGAWGGVTVTNYPLADYTVKVPFSSYPPAMRATMGNHLVDALSLYPSTSIPANATALANFVDLSEAQTITGVKTLAEATITDFTVGATAELKGVTILEGTPQINWAATAGALDARKSAIYLDSSGLTLRFWSDDLSAWDDVLTITRSGDENGVLGTFSVPLVAPTFEGILTNASSTNTVIHATTLVSDLAIHRGRAWISNSAPELSLIDTDANANLKWWKLRGVGSGALTALALSVTTDAGADDDVLQISRGGGGGTAADVGFTFLSHVEFQDGVEFSGGSVQFVDDIRTGDGIVIGDDTAALPAGLVGGAYFINGTGPAADPATGWVTWSEAGNMFYRASTASEGAGQDNRYHNRVEEVFAAGTDYSLTASTAFVDAGTTDPKITLPTEGTWWIEAEAAIESGATANDTYNAKLRNETTATDLTGSDAAISYLGTTQLGTIYLKGRVTTATASNVIAIWAHNAAARGKVVSARTRIRAVRLY